MFVLFVWGLSRESTGLIEMSLFRRHAKDQNVQMEQ